MLLKSYHSNRQRCRSSRCASLRCSLRPLAWPLRSGRIHQVRSTSLHIVQLGWVCSLVLLCISAVSLEIPSVTCLSARALSPIPSLIPSHHRRPHTLSRRGPRHRHCVHAPREPRGVQHGRVCAHSMGLQHCGALVSGCLARMPIRHFSIVVGTRAKRERALCSEQCRAVAIWCMRVCVCASTHV